MNPLSWKRDIAVNYHLEEGKAWLLESKRGKRCTALSYAAFEFRLAIERILFQYWYTINENEINEDNISDVRSFKKMKNKIFKLAGVQKEINKHFEFMQFILDSLGLDIKLATPDFGRLHNYWSSCSELCHITWTITPKDRKFKREVLLELETIRDILENYTNNLTSFPVIKDENFKNIQQKYGRGEIELEAVKEYLQSIGIWALQEDKNGDKSFVGTPIEKNITKG